MELRRAEPEAIAAAARRLEAGGLVAFPTETVYGLGADATRPEAVAAVFELKGRPRFNPLIVHVLDLEAAARHGEVGAGARRLAARFWPGPLTLVLRRRDDCPVCPLAAAGLDTLALRAPSHPVARALLGESGLALAAPSANPSGRLSPTAARHVARAFPGADLLVLDAGASELGLESTVVDLSDPERAMLLRPGSIGAGEVAAALGSPVHDGMAGQVRAPGMSEGHYAPRAALRLGAARAGARRMLPGLRRHAGDRGRARGRRAQSQPLRRSARGRRQSLRHAARARPARHRRHRRGADPGTGPGARHHGPPAPRRGGALKPAPRARKTDRSGRSPLAGASLRGP